MKILETAQKTRFSRRYPGYTRVLVTAYQRALIAMIRRDGKDLVEAFKMGRVLDDLEKRINRPEVNAAWGRLSSGILGEEAENPMAMKGRAFNSRAEAYYGKILRQGHIGQGFDRLEKAFEKMDLWARYRDVAYGNAITQILGEEDMFKFLKRMRQDFIDEKHSADRLKKLIYLIILVVQRDMQTWDDAIRQ
ncbi:MAG TPA: hypothetical protein DHV36_21400 [Desulfobacteraceae bacterium]|nr:hypothetical protein [Desulfobacteraceae bacterium]